jgi:UDP-glucose 4-epimerase
MEESMNYLVTGVAGFIGSHIAEKLIADGHLVIGIDNLIGGYIDNVPSGVVFFNIDLDHLEEIEPLFKNVDTVIHAACTAYEGLSVFSPSLVVRNTVQITANVMSCSVRHKVKKVVYLSSMARYGSQETIPFTEDMVPNPQDPYGISKLAAEKLVENIASTHGIEFVILVPHNVIGPRQKYDDPYRNVASIMINRMLHGKQPIIYGNGNQKRCFSFINDVIDPLITACNSKLAVGKTINIGPDEEFITINELAQHIARIINFSLDPIYVPGRPLEVEFASCSADLARKLLSYNTKTNLDHGLVQLVEYIKTRGLREFNYHLPIEFITEKTPKTWSEKLI